MTDRVFDDMKHLFYVVVIVIQRIFVQHVPSTTRAVAIGLL